MKIKAVFYQFLLFMLLHASAWAALGDSGNQPVSQPIMLLVALGALSLAPFVIIMVTSFVKLAVVLGLVRNALGTQQIPPNPVVTGLAMVLSIYIMMPVAAEIQTEVSTIIRAQTGKPLISDATMQVIFDAANKGKEPLRRFLLRHAHQKDRAMFFNLAKRLRKDKVEREKVSNTDFIIVVPSFITSELKEAFQIGFIIFMPFLIIDMVVANVLLAMGMMMLSPITISLPFKLLLFVLVDGWYLITRGLILGYL